MLYPMLRALTKDVVISTSAFGKSLGLLEDLNSKRSLAEAQLVTGIVAGEGTTGEYSRSCMLLQKDC